MSEPSERLDEMKGSFVTTLRRNNKQIRDDRAITIAKTAKMLFKRSVEDLEFQLDNLRTDRDNMLDLNGNSTTAIINPSDFKGVEFVQDDLKMGLEIRNLEIKLEIANKRYVELFEGEE